VTGTGATGVLAAPPAADPVARPARPVGRDRSAAGAAAASTPSEPSAALPATGRTVLVVRPTRCPAEAIASHARQLTIITASSQLLTAAAILQRLTGTTRPCRDSA
jgi:hypothetical protein